MFSPASDRNKEPILNALRTHLPPQGKCLELACGSMQHALHFAPAFPLLRWQPTDISTEALEHGQHLADLPENVARPCYLDVTKLPWPFDDITAVYTANLLHISPAIVVEGLFAGARMALCDNGRIVVYGPFRVAGQHTSASNAAFDADLRARNPAWGIRDLETVETHATHNGFALQTRIKMPANNQLLVFGR